MFLNGAVGWTIYTAFNPTSQKCRCWNCKYVRSVFFSSQGGISQEQVEEQIFPIQVSGEAATSREAPAVHLLLNAVWWLERWEKSLTALDGHEPPRVSPR